MKSSSFVKIVYSQHFEFVKRNENYDFELFPSGLYTSLHKPDIIYITVHVVLVRFVNVQTRFMITLHTSTYLYYDSF